MTDEVPMAIPIEDILPTVTYKSTEVKKSVDPYVDLGNLLLEDLDLLETGALRCEVPSRIDLSRSNIL